jgi:small subunit ribosomal protein S4
MSKYTGPRLKKIRSLGAELPGLTRKKAERRPHPPGQHGQARKKFSDYAVRLREKQKLRYNYGLTEKHLRRIVVEAKAGKGVTGDRILELLERRLDNVVWRAGFAVTIPAARQLVNHGHVLVNGKRLDIASARVNVGDIITIADRYKENTHLKDAVAGSETARPSWIGWESDTQRATITALPERDSVLLQVDVQLIIEYYSRSL